VSAKLNSASCNRCRCLKQLLIHFKLIGENIQPQTPTDLTSDSNRKARHWEATSKRLSLYFGGAEVICGK